MSTKEESEGDLLGNKWEVGGFMKMTPIRHGGSPDRRSISHLSGSTTWTGAPCPRSAWLKTMPG